MINLKKFSLDGLVALIRRRGLDDYRGRQIFQWLWQKEVLSFDSMTDLSRRLRESFKDEFYVGSLRILRRTEASDSSVKYLFELEDGLTIESVYMPEIDRKSVCVSVQVGCGLGCRFCATGQFGFERNLLGWEIADQVISVQRVENVRITNVVFMGMGEPMLNIDAVFQACQILNSDLGPNIGARRMTVSTAGLPEGIIKFAALPMQLKLAISLNATTDELRNMIMPINKKHSIKDVIEAIRRYQFVKNRMVTIEYVMIKDFNITPIDARRLISLMSDLRCKINLIPFNPFPGCEFTPPGNSEMMSFYNILLGSDKTVTIRNSRGSDIGAGCGQLKSSVLLTS